MAFPDPRPGDGLSTCDRAGRFWIAYVADPQQLAGPAPDQLARCILGLEVYRERVQQMTHAGNRSWYTRRCDQQLAAYAAALAAALAADNVVPGSADVQGAVESGVERMA
jgi:hypothetical protein